MVNANLLFSLPLFFLIFSFFFSSFFHFPVIVAVVVPVSYDDLRLKEEKIICKYSFFISFIMFCLIV